jgi:arylsulfatase A-like enzyme
MPDRPDIIVLMADTVATAAVGCYGSPYVQTPRIDALARSATLFERAYQPANVCQPSRITWLTGCLPSTHGIYFNTFGQYRRKERTLLRALADAGYKGGYLGTFHCWDEPDRDGLDDWSWIDWIHDFAHPDKTGWRTTPAQEAAFQRHLDALGIVRYEPHLKDFRHEAGYTDFPIEQHFCSRLTAKAIDCIDDFATDRPNLLWLSWWLPHEPWAPPAPWHAMYGPDDVVLPASIHDPRTGRPPQQSAGENVERFRAVWDADGGRSFRRAMAAYAGCMSYIDHEMGRVVDHLVRRGRFDDSLIVVLSDHGTANGAHGWLGKAGPYMIDEISRIPLIIKQPGQRTARRIPDIVASADLHPTILALLGLPCGPVDGRPLPGIGGEPSRSDAYALGQHHDGSDDAGAAVRMLRRGRWKYNLYSQSGMDELYDLDEDPAELRNLAAIALPERRALRDELIGRIRASGDRFVVR